MCTKGSNIKITVNTISVSYNDHGPDDAPVFIFIHGFPFNKSMWDNQMEALQEDFRVIAYDVRGHGDSDEGNEEFSIDLFVKDLIGLMDELELEKVTLCGLSMGGYIALRAFEQYSERFEALVLSDTNCNADTAEATKKRMKTIGKIRENGMNKYVDEMIKNLFSPESFTTKPDEITMVREMILNTSTSSLCNTLLALAVRKETCSKLEKINVPVLIMVGKEDLVTPPEEARFMHEKIENSSFSIINHAGHLANLENPQEFNQQLKTFVHQYAERWLQHAIL